jgi:hypothetical protein
LTLTVALPFNVNVHVFVLLPPLEHAPDQMASRLFVTRSVIDVPVAKDAEPVVPTLTLIPVGVDVTRSPLRPVAVTVNVDDCTVGFTVSVVVRVLLPYAAVMVTGVAAVTAVVLAVKVALAAPPATITFEGTETAACPLESDTEAPPAGAPADSNTVPCEDEPPVTLVGLTLTLCSVASGGGGGGGGDPPGVTVSVAVRVEPL